MSEGVSLEAPGAPLPLRAIGKGEKQRRGPSCFRFHIYMCFKNYGKLHSSCAQWAHDPLQEILNLPLSS